MSHVICMFWSIFLCARHIMCGFQVHASKTCSLDEKQRNIFCNPLKVGFKKWRQILFVESLGSRWVNCRIQKFLFFSDFLFLSKISIWWQFLHPHTILPSFKTYFPILPRWADFYMTTITINYMGMHFYWFSEGFGGESPPKKNSGGFSNRYIYI